MISDFVPMDSSQVLAQVVSSIESLRTFTVTTFEGTWIVVLGLLMALETSLLGE